MSKHYPALPVCCGEQHFNYVETTPVCGVNDAGELVCTTIEEFIELKCVYCNTSHDFPEDMNITYDTSTLD